MQTAEQSVLRVFGANAHATASTAAAASARRMKWQSPGHVGPAPRYESVHRTARSPPQRLTITTPLRRNSHHLNTHHYQLKGGELYCSTPCFVARSAAAAFELSGRDHVIPSDPVVDMAHSDG
jgi:hypothetical protein